MHACLHTYVHTYIHAYTHIRTYTHTCIPVQARVPHKRSHFDKALSSLCAFALHWYRRRPIMPPKLSAAQIDEKLERLHAFVCEHAALFAIRNGLSLRTSLRQTASVEERTWYQFLCKNESAFSEPQNNRVLRAYPYVLSL